MSTTVKGILVGVGLILILNILIFASGGMGAIYTRTIGKWKQDAQREVFEQTQSYHKGMLQELSDAKLEYVKGDDEVKAAIIGTMRHRFAEFDEADVPDHLKDFYFEVMY